MGITVLKCENLNKNFGKKQILKNVSFEIEEGDILGFIGPNGARKNDNNKINTRSSKHNKWQSCNKWI